MTKRVLAYVVAASVLSVGVGGVGDGGSWWAERRAEACGCLAPPDPASPVVQAGERILFATKNGQVTAHIQIQYSGEAADFGWLLPLPSVPTLEIGSEELFAQLEARTAPSYYQQVIYPQDCKWPPFGGGGGSDLGQFASPDMGIAGGGDPSPLVVQSSIGPYDYAVLKADDKTAMLDWLAKSHYFVPAGTDAILTPYIHPGAYFLALKLKSGQSAGDIAPVVVHYGSDLPMIPLILTSVTTAAILDVTTWVIGDGRAIPRNYHHVVLDDALINWGYGQGKPIGYADLVRSAMTEVSDHHAFVTEMAEPISTLTSPIVPQAMLEAPMHLRVITQADGYLRVLKLMGFSFSPALVAVLAKYIKQPPTLKDIQGNVPSPANYLYNFDFWRSRYAQYFVGFDLTYDPVALTAEIDALAVKPLRDAASLFEGSRWLTRLYTRIAATEMNSDPVFSFNPQLPAVSNEHKSVRTMRCGKNPYTYEGRDKTESGFEIDDQSRPLKGLPAAERIEILRESGAPEVVKDNRARIVELIGPLPEILPPTNQSDQGGKSGVFAIGGGCSVSAPRGAADWRVGFGVGLLAVLGLALGRARRRGV